MVQEALTKQEKVTGSNTNYYLQILLNNVSVEAEDIIEHCKMSFATGCCFKAIWRLCKLRQGLGKPGATTLYDAEKSFYYAQRDRVATQRRLSDLTGFQKAVRFIRDTFGGNPFYDPLSIIIDIPDPKRLDPYSFSLGELIEALKPTDAESQVLIDTVTLSLMRQIVGPGRRDEYNRCDSLVHHAKRILDREKIREKRTSHV